MREFTSPVIREYESACAVRTLRSLDFPVEDGNENNVEQARAKVWRKIRPKKFMGVSPKSLQSIV